ncbi:MAG TPA: hypothetical protein VKU37_12815 [Verrucomicrobiae bacterium]|nr:hypothetical protein [Verrucomicrobiae bacterium]
MNMPNHSILKITIILVSVVGALVDQADAIIYPISSSLDLHAEANAGAGLVQDDNGMSQGTGLDALSASVFAQATNGTLNATAQSSASATWISAGAGQVSIDTRFTTDDLGSFIDSRVATGGPGWTYTFSSDQPAVLTLNYGITHTGYDPYETLLFLEQLNNSGVVKQVQLATPPASGVLSFTINPNVNYTFQIFDDSNVNQFLPASASEITGIFSFQITPVPEPGGLSLLGIATVAACLPRRRNRRT